MTPLLLGFLMLGTAVQSDTVPLYDDLGDHHHPITTQVSRTQAYFDQGLRLTYAFNHAEAIRSFERGAQLDPACAMCYWGIALALGPNINAGMAEAEGRAAWKAISRALELAPEVSAPERAYIEALAQRYGADPLTDRDGRNHAWATAMADVADAYPGDDDAAVFAASAQMNLSPWDYWETPDRPRPNGRAALERLSTVTQRSPDHVGACHYYIHIVEEHHPQRAIDCAERLPTLMPGAGHIVHMPAHVYIRVGRYADAVERNVHATHADEEHLEDFSPDGAYLMAYYPHNYHFLWFAASMAGMGETAIDAARHTSERVDADAMRMPELRMLQHFSVTPLFALVRFRRWDAILAEAEPARDLVYPRGVWHYARSVAMAARGDAEGAAQELEALRGLRDELIADDIAIWDLNPASSILRIGERVATAELLALRGRADAALEALTEAQAIEETLTYDEPPTWHMPVNQIRGLMLLRAERPGPAAEAFAADLDRFPDNGWSLWGLAEALTALGQEREAATVREQFQRAWKSADIDLGVGVTGQP